MLSQNKSTVKTSWNSANNPWSEAVPMCATHPWKQLSNKNRCRAHTPRIRHKRAYTHLCTISSNRVIWLRYWHHHNRKSKSKNSNTNWKSENYTLEPCVRTQKQPQRESGRTKTGMGFCKQLTMQTRKQNLMRKFVTKPYVRRTKTTQSHARKPETHNCAASKPQLRFANATAHANEKLQSMQSI